MLDKLKKYIHDGEGLTVEFKRCENELANSIYETVSAFSNRYGGYILLGVEDDGECYLNSSARALSLRQALIVIGNIKCKVNNTHN